MEAALARSSPRFPRLFPPPRRRPTPPLPSAAYKQEIGGAHATARSRHHGATVWAARSSAARWPSTCALAPSTRRRRCGVVVVDAASGSRQGAGESDDDLLDTVRKSSGEAGSGGSPSGEARVEEEEERIREMEDVAQMRDPSTLNPAFVAMGEMIDNLPFVGPSKKNRGKKRRRAAGETASYVRKQDSSVFGIVEGLGLQYKMGVYQQVDEDRLDDDPGLNQLLISPGSSISQLFTQDMWERHRGVSRYWRHLSTTLRSTVFTRVLEPVIITTAWAVVIAAWNSWLVPTLVRAGWTAAVPLGVSSVAHALAGTALGLTLVFRTNSSFARLVEARVLLGNLVRLVRDLARLAQYIPDAAGTARQEIVQYAAAIGYSCEAHCRRGRTRANPDDPTAFRVDPTVELTRIIGREKTEEYMRAENKPMFLAGQASKALRRSLEAGMPEMMHHECETTVTQLHLVIGGCERIQSTPIPVSYTRHTSRSLMIWLLTLPFALWPVMDLATVPATFLMTFLMLGIDEIGVQIEEPFAVLPVRPLVEVCERDVRELDKHLELGAFDHTKEATREDTS